MTPKQERRLAQIEGRVQEEMPCIVRSERRELWNHLSWMRADAEWLCGLAREQAARIEELEAEDAVLKRAVEIQRERKRRARLEANSWRDG